MVKLFEAKSYVEGFLHCESARFFWYCKDREKPAFPFEEVIMDYKILGEGQKMFAEREINKYFTETEIMELEEYLHRVYELDLEAPRIQLPMKSHDGGDECLLMDPDILGFFSLYKDEGYNLSMRVVAQYYLTDHSPISYHHLPTIHRKNGEMFANALFKKLNVSTPTNLGKVIEEIYGETYLFVSKR